MNSQLKAALLIVGSTVLWIALSWQAGEWRGYPIFGGMLVGNLAMWLAIVLAQREDRNKQLYADKRKRWFASLILLVPGLAKALLLLVAVVAIGAGLVGLLGIKIWSKALSIKLNELKKPIVLEQAMISVTQPGFALAAVALPNPEPEFELAGAGDSPELIKALSIVVPANAYLQYSTNMVTWSNIHHSGPSDEMTFWEMVGAHGFFRLMSYNENPPPTAAAPVDALPAAQQ